VELGTIFRALPTLQTSRLILRPLTAEDSEAVFAYSQDPEVARYTGWDAARSISEAEAFVQSVLQRYGRGSPAPWGVVHRAHQQLIGTCGFSAYSPISGTGFLSYAYSRAYWGQGLATEAAVRAIEFGFTVIGLARIQAMCISENIGSWRVMEKAGLLREGILKGLGTKGPNRWDLGVYSLTRADWAQHPQS
jgi:ribosomal-protein-alanine N-acetyltransferase